MLFLIGIFVLGSSILTAQYNTTQVVAETNQSTSNASIWVTNSTIKIFQSTDSNDALHTMPGSAKAVSLSVAKNGRAFFQVVVTAGTSQLTGVSVSPNDLVGSGSNIIDSSNVKVFLEYYVNVQSQTDYESVISYNLGLYPDALVPLSTSFDVAAGKNQPLWIEISVPQDAAPDTYAGALSFSGGISGTIDITLKVLNFAVPTHSGLHNPGYADFWILNSDETLINAYTKFFEEHDIDLAMTFDPFDIVPKKTGDTWNFDEWYQNYVKLYNAGVKEFNPHVLRVPISFSVLGVDPTDASRDDVQEDFVSFLQQFKTFIQSKTEMVTNSHWFVWIDELDEPADENAAWAIAKYAELTASVSDDNFEFHYRIDGSIDWNSSAIQYYFDEDLSKWADLSDKFSIWLAPQEDFEFDLSFIQEKINEGRKVMLYQQAWSAYKAGSEEIPPGFDSSRNYEFPSLPGIVNPAIFHRILPWFAWKYDAVGIGFWAVMAWYSAKTDSIIDVWTDDPALWINPFGTLEHAQSGDGWLIYPGDKVNEHTGQADVTGPVASLRLELFRKGLEDYKYLELLKRNLDNLDSTSKNTANQLITQVNSLLNTITTFDRNPEKYDNLLHQIKEILNSNAANLNMDLTIDWNSNFNPSSAPKEPAEKNAFPFPSFNFNITLVALFVLTALIFTRKRRKLE